jgi:hypothetical protein
MLTQRVEDRHSCKYYVTVFQKLGSSLGKFVPSLLRVYISKGNTNKMNTFYISIY